MENNPKIERKCKLCKKKIKKFAKWNDGKVRLVHRKCWLNFRDFEDRFYDVLFCPDKKDPKKTVTVKPE